LLLAQRTLPLDQTAGPSGTGYGRRVRTSWLAAALMVAACGHSAPPTAPTSTNAALNAMVYSDVEFKLKYRPLFASVCTSPSCYLTVYKPVFDRLPLDYGALHEPAQSEVLTRIQAFFKGSDALTQQGCGDPAKDSSTQCRQAATGPAASVDYLRSYVNS
jgi:hypothetical protein